MTDKLFAIGQVTKVAGQYGEFRVRPLSRYFQAYVEDKPLHLGASELLSKEVKLRNKQLPNILLFFYTTVRKIVQRLWCLCEQSQVGT